MTNSPVQYTADGFPGQRMRVVPRPVVLQALESPTTGRLLVTDCGYFPHAERHRKIRRIGVGVAVVIACVRGRGMCEIDGVRYPVRAGEILVIPPGAPHQYEADDEDPWTIWWIHLAGDALPGLLASARVDRDGPLFAVADISRIALLIEEIIARIERDETESTLVAAAGAAWHLMGLLATEQVPLGSRTNPVAQAQDYLRAHIGVRTSLPELAKLVGLSASHFSALFRAETGTGVIEYQTRLRMGIAREMLDMTDSTVGQTAHAIGYPDAFYFSRQFRLIHGVSPREYRERAHNEMTAPLG